MIQVFISGRKLIFCVPIHQTTNTLYYRKTKTQIVSASIKGNIISNIAHGFMLTTAIAAGVKETHLVFSACTFSFVTWEKQLKISKKSMVWKWHNRGCLPQHLPVVENKFGLRAEGTVKCLKISFWTAALTLDLIKRGWPEAPGSPQLASGFL